MTTLAERALQIAAAARAREDRQRVVTQHDRLAAAARTKAEAPELYEFAVALRKVFGNGTAVRWVRFPDGSTWGDDRADEGTKVPASGSPIVLHKGRG